MTVSEELEQFIKVKLARGRQIATITNDEDLLSRGLIDSLGVTHLTSFLETKYGVEITDDDFVPENFQSISNIMEFLARKKRN